MTSKKGSLLNKGGKRKSSGSETLIVSEGRPSENAERCSEEEKISGHVDHYSIHQIEEALLHELFDVKKQELDLLEKRRKLQDFRDISCELAKKRGESSQGFSNLQQPSALCSEGEVQGNGTQASVQARISTRSRVQAEDKWQKEIQRLKEEEKMKRTKLEEDLKLAQRNVEEEKEKLLCQICLVKTRNALLLPCMHLLYCHDCLLVHKSRNNSCPTCRGTITALLQCNLQIE
ncbi:hypothetical protein R1flu_012810 [Riccia fluitans]|uniref:RING-type domain-containing protein n=1 Tax=Riccia fluitans TaxID=41844 RepID=A0ABD1ZBN6_9MARC